MLIKLRNLGILLARRNVTQAGIIITPIDVAVKGQNSLTGEMSSLTASSLLLVISRCYTQWRF